MIQTAHATAVGIVVATGIYIVVPPFVPVIAAMAPDVPTSARMLAAGYPFAFVLPLAAAALGIALKPESRGRRLLVPLTYVVGVAVAGFVALALYVAFFELS